MSLVDDGQRDAEVENLQVAHLLGQRDDLGQEIDAQAESVAASADARALSVDRKNAPRHAQSALLHFASPIFEDFLRVQLDAETITIGFQFLTFDVILPALA